MEERHARTAGITIICVLLVVDSLAAFAELFLELPIQTRVQAIDALGSWAVGAFLVLGALRIVAAALLWRGSRRGWVLAMLLVGASLLFNLYLYWIDEPNRLRLLLNVALVFYLNQGAVRDVYLRPSQRPSIPMRSSE